MAGNAVAEFCGHVIYSFTRSVAERYNFHEADDNLELFGYNPLNDTGREWYCRPVDEVIYQEYSNREATSADYLVSGRIDAKSVDAAACSDDNEPEQQAVVAQDDSSMAWKKLRPSFFGTVRKSVLFGFLMSVFSATVVGIVSILVYYISFQTQLVCFRVPEKSIPRKLQWFRTISETVFVSFYYYWFLLNVLFYFRLFQISGLKLDFLVTCTSFYFLDAFYRIAIQAFGFSHFQLTSAQVLPGNALLFLCLCAQCCIIVRHFGKGPRKKQLSLFMFITVQFPLMFISGILLAYFVYPAYLKQNETGKVLLAIVTPFITVILKGMSRFCVQQIWSINHPGTSFVLLAPIYCGSAVMLRLLQIDMESTKAIALTGVIHGLAEVIERSCMVLIDHLCHQLWERRVARCGDLRTPRRERLAADNAIKGMLYESHGIISVNGFLHLYHFFFTQTKLFPYSCFIPLP